MQLPEAITLVTELIKTDATHPDYEHTVKLAAKYKAMITGEDVGAQLIQFIQREDKEAFDQRVRLTQTITPAVANSVRRPFNKVIRSDRVKKKAEVKENAGRTKAVQEMIKSFFGDPKKKTTGLDYWLKTRFLDLQFIDPNAWIVLEWSNPGNLSTIAKPRPFEVTSSEAKNFEIENDEVKWLWVGQDIMFKSGSADDFTEKPGMRWILYDSDFTIVLTQIDKQYFQATTNILNPEFLEIGENGEKEFLLETFEPKIGYPPVIRVGYVRDDITDARTFVNPWHSGLCFFEKLLTTVSELDLTIALHTFPQKLQYVSKCRGADAKRKCKEGYCNDGTPCSRCGGKGYEIHTTAQEAILLPMPDDGKDMIPLEDILVYKTPPIELIKFQNDYSLQLERQVHQAVFNSQVFVQNHYSSESSGDGVEKTAYEVDSNMESVYDTLEPFTEKTSEVYRDFVATFAIIAGEKDTANVDAVHEFPADYKLKTSGILMSERKRAIDSGAPAFILEGIDDDLAAIQYSGDEYGLNKYKVRRRYFPFNGKTVDEIAELMTSEFVPESDKVLYSNFENIFRDLDRQDKKFYLSSDLAGQKAKVDKAVEDLMAKLSAAKPQPVFNTNDDIPE